MQAMSDLTAYTKAFQAPDGEPAWLAERRRGALARFAELGLPTRRQEDWRFTNLRAPETTLYPPAASETAVAESTLAPYRLGVPSHRIVLVNGRYSAALSDVSRLPTGVRLGSLAAALRDLPDLAAELFDGSEAAANQPFVAVNAAFAGDGFVLVLDDGVSLELPVEIIHLCHAQAPVSGHTLPAIIAGKHSRARIVESHVGSGPYWRNAVATIRLGEGAVLDHVTLQDEARKAIHISTTRVGLAAASRYDAFTLTLGAQL